MKKIVLTSLLCLAWLPVADAASCRAYTAANSGSQTGYNNAKQAADAWSQRENQVTSSLEECLGDISSLIMMPKFPSLGGLLNKVEQQVCEAAQGEIDKYVPSTIDPWGDIPTTSTRLSVSQTMVTPPPVAATPVPSDITEPDSSTPPATTSFSLN